MDKIGSRLDGLETQVATLKAESAALKKESKTHETESKALKKESMALKEECRVAKEQIGNAKKLSARLAEQMTNLFWYKLCEGNFEIPERTEMTDDELTYWIDTENFHGSDAVTDAQRYICGRKMDDFLMFELYGLKGSEVLKLSKYWSLLQMFAY